MSNIISSDYSVPISRTRCDRCGRKIYKYSLVRIPKDVFAPLPWKITETDTLRLCDPCSKIIKEILIFIINIQ